MLSDEMPLDAGRTRVSVFDQVPQGVGVLAAADVIARWHTRMQELTEPTIVRRSLDAVTTLRPRRGCGSERSLVPFESMWPVLNSCGFCASRQADGAAIPIPSYSSSQTATERDMAGDPRVGPVKGRPVILTPECQTSALERSFLLQCGRTGHLVLALHR